MGSNCCKGDAAGKPVVRTGSSVYSRSRAGAKLSERFTSSHNAGGVRLSISAARTGDSGVYTLQASNAAGKDTTRVRLEVSPDEMPTGDDPPTFLRRLQDLTVKVGTRTRFLVEIVSSTECRVTWYRNERRLMEAERIALVRDGNFWCADISAVSVDDAGRWTCTAENIGGRASCSAHLNVLVPKAYKRPEFMEELRALLTEQGTVSLECKVVGVPTPVLRWFKDSREIKAGDVFALTANAEDPTSLGTYTCEAVNCMGRAYSSSKVQVVGRSSREGSSRPSSGGVMLEPPPIFTKELEDQFVRICERLTLSCQIVVPPWPRTVVWYNKEGKVESNDKYHIIEDGVGGYFIEIQTSEFPDEGEWKCVATSTGGRVGISTCYVSMDIPKNYRKPRFMENLQAVLTEEGLVSFECKVVGFPTPVLSWFKDGQELKPGDVYQLTGTNSLGSYCCIARNFMGQASSSAELTVEDIQNQLNEEEKLQLFSKNQAPKYLQGLKSVEAKIDEPFRFTIKVAIPPEPTVLWYRDEQPVDESSRCHLGNEERGSFFLDIQNLEFMDQAEWKCVAMNDYGQSVTSCFLKLVIPRHYKKPRFLENLQALLSDEGAVNLECKVIGVPQPILKWYKDGEELKPGDIHRIISGQDGTCCLGTYTCEAQNCMGIAASSASLLGFEDSLKAKNKKKADEQTLQRNLSLSTIHEERTSQMYDTPVGDITLDDKGEISFSFDGKEVSVSLYETPDLTEEEALQIVEMYADQLSENVTEHNVVELPPLRFVKETSTSGNLLMEAIIIDVSPEYFTSPEEDLRTEADIEDISIAEENGPLQLSLDQDVSGEDYIEKTMALLSEERVDVSKKIERKKSDSQKSADDYFSLSRDRSFSEEKKDDDTQVLSESDLQSFASAHSTEKPKSKSSKPSLEDGQESSDFTKTVLLREDLKAQVTENIKSQKDRRGSRGSRRSTSSEKSPLVIRKELLEIEVNKNEQNKIIAENIKMEMMSISSSLTKVMNAIQIIERDIILKSELMSVAATASRSLEIINSLITPISEIHSITDTITETETESPEIIGSLFNRLPQSLGMLEQSLTIVEKCIDYESDNKTLVKKTCVSLIENCGDTLRELITAINTVAYNEYTFINDICISNIKTTSESILKTLKSSVDASKQDKILNETNEDKIADISSESKHLHYTQKVLYALKSSLKSVLAIIEGSDATFKSFADIKNAQIILGEISTPIQELQNALEQIETLSVAESDSNLPKFNTGIIESVINSVLKLRTAFEQLSTEKENKINEVLFDIKQNIYSISTQLDLFEEKNGKFDILHNDNKLEVLQTMAQILISLENSLPILDTIPNLKTNMSDFHKNLTKVLESVIESNNSTKYFTLLEICSAISRINTSLSNMESQQVLSLAIINNTLKIIQRSLRETIFDNSLNESVLNNISGLMLDIQETINQVEESTSNVESEKLDDLSIKLYEENKIISVLEHVQKTIASMSKVVSFENVENLTIAQVFENINPILTEIQCCVASLNVNTIEHSENVTDMTISSFTEAIAHPLCELHQNITVLNEVICEIAKNHELIQLTAFAEPLIELQTTLEILQTEVISQYEEIVQCPAILGSIANSVDNLQSCILKIQEHDVLEVVDDMSTLDDISGIKTTADILLPSEFMSSIENIKIKEIPVIHENVTQEFSTQALQTIHKHILSLQDSVIAKNIKALPDDNEHLPIKSLILELELISSDIEGSLQPITMEEPQLLLLNPSKLISMIQPLEHLQESLSVVNASNNIFSEHFEEITQTQVFTENLLNLKVDIDEFLNISQLAVEAVDAAVDTAAKRVALQQLPEKLEILLSEYINFPLDKTLKIELTKLREDILNAVKTNLSDNINAEVNEIIEKVNKSISKVQDEGFTCTAQSLNILSHESNLVKTLIEMEQCIATLEKCDFSEEFVILTPETDNQISQITRDTVVDPLIHLDQITKVVVNAMCNEFSDENDVKLTEEFVDTFTKQISLLRYLIKNRPSPKQIIKSLQVFYALLSNLNDYKSRFHYTLSDEFNGCLNASLDDMENCLKNMQTILVQIINSQSELLFENPQRKINKDEQFLKNILQSKNDKLRKTCSVILNIIETSKPFNINLKDKMIEELSTYEHRISQQDIADFHDNYDYLASFLTTQAKKSLEKPLKEITDKLLHVIKKHEDVKDILGIGSRIIFNQCISDCVDLLKQCSVEFKLKENIEKCITKDVNIDELLLEISEPLESFNTQMINIRNKIILASEKNIDMTELKTLESHVNVIKEVNENIKLCISNNGLSLDKNDVALIMELNNKIHLIYNNLTTLESTPIFETVKLVINPLEEIERNLHIIISYNKDLIDKKSQNNKEKADALLQQMEQHIEIIEIVEEVSAVIKLDDLKKTASIVRELRGSIAGSENAIDSSVEECSSITTDQIPLTDKLQKALISLQSQALDSAQQDTVNVKEDIRQTIIDAVSDLQNNLIQLTNIPLKNHLENVNNAQTDIVEEKDNQIMLTNSDKPIDEIKYTLKDSDFDQIIQNADIVAEQPLILLEMKNDVRNLVPDSILPQELGVKDLQIKDNYESKYNLPSNETSEHVYSSDSLIDNLMENIKEYLRQDITDIAKQFASCLNHEAVKITQDISQQFCQDSDLNNYLRNETTGSLLMADEQLKILSNLYKNLESIFICEPTIELEEVVAQDKLIQFKNVTNNLCEAIKKLNISTQTAIKSTKSEELAMDSSEVIEPKIEVNGSLSENQTFSSNDDVQKLNDTSDNLTDNNSLGIQKEKDSKSEEMDINMSVDANRKEDLRLEAWEENLMQYIRDYVSEEATEILKQSLFKLNTEHLEKSHQIANQLFTLCTGTNFDETNMCNILKEKFELTVQLNESISVIYNEMFDETKNLPNLDKKDKLPKIQSVLKNLSEILKTYIIFEQHVPLEQVIEMDKSKQELDIDSILRTEQNVDKVDIPEETADLVYKIEELKILSAVNKDEDKILRRKMSETIRDKCDDSLNITESEHVMIETDHKNEINSIQKLEKLLQEVNDNIDLSLTNVEYSDIIQNNLDEVQSVIIKLKYDFDGITNDILNETLEDLECNVRSVQLQIHEQSPPELLKEACSNLQVIVACLNNIEEVKEMALVSKINTVIYNCSEEADQTIQLLDKACCLEKNSKLDNIISSLNNVKDIMKSLRTSVVGDSETLILKGIDITQNLDHVEDTIFSLEKDVDKLNDIHVNIKDEIITAMHSVYGSISNMRGAISSIQKRYMYENYGKPSQNFLRSIKNIADISQLSGGNKLIWKKCAKCFRKVLNHFEDIKFYINFDRTARIPNDAAFTKIILRETMGVLDEVKKIHDINSSLSKTITDLSNYVNNKNIEIEEKTTLEVKEKIPIFIDISVKILEATELIKLQLQDNTENVYDPKYIQIDDNEQNKLTDLSTVIIHGEEVQEIFDLNLESTELVLLSNKENEEIVKVATEPENVFEEASKMESIAVVQNLSNLQDYQKNDNEQKATDNEQVRKENMLKEFEIMKMPSEDLRQRDNYVDFEEIVQMQEDINLTCSESKSAEDISPISDFSNVVTTEYDKLEEQDMLTRQEIRDSEQVSERLINIDKCELLVMEDNVKAETTLKSQEDNNVIDALVKENLPSDILNEITLDTDTSSELSEQLTTHSLITKNVQLNEDKGKINILENSEQVGLLTNSDLGVDSKPIIIEDNHHHQAIDTNIETSINIQENKTETQPMDDKETEKTKICQQSQENILLKIEEHDINFKIYKNVTNEYNQPLSFSELPAISEKLKSDIISNENKSEEVTLQIQVIDKEQKVELYEDTSIAKKEETCLPDKEKNIQETQNIANKDLNSVNEKGNIMTSKDLCKKGVLENMDDPEAIFNKTTDLAPQDKDGISITNETTITSSLSTKILNTETSLFPIIKDTDQSLINKEKESRTDIKNHILKEQEISEELLIESDMQKEDDILQKDPNITIEDENLEKVTEGIKNHISKEEREGEEKEEYIDHSEMMVNDESQLLQDKISKLKPDEVIHSSSLNKFEEERNEEIKESIKQHAELVPGVVEEPLVNVQTDLNEKTEVTKSFIHEKAAVNNNAENEILNIIKDMDIKQIDKQNHSDIFDSPVDTILKEEDLNDKHKATVTEISEKDNNKDHQGSVIVKENIIINDDKSMIDKEKQEESVKSNITESDSQIVFSEPKEKYEQKLDVNMQSHLENKTATELKSERIEATEVKPENKEMIDNKFNNSGNKTSVKKNDEKRLVNILENKDINQINKQEQSDNKDLTIPADLREKKEYSDSDKKNMVSEILQKDDKKDDQESVTFLKDVINKDHESLNYVEEQEESVTCKQPEANNQIVLCEAIHKNIEKPNVKVQSDLENKEATELKPENKEVIEVKSYKGGKKASLRKNEENELVKVLEAVGTDQIKEQEQLDEIDSNFPVDKREKIEDSGSEKKPTVTEVLDKDDKKEDQRNITVKEDVINKDDDSSILKEKQEESLKCNQTESNNQITFIESIAKDIKKPNIYVQSEIEKKKAIDVKPENKEVIDAICNKDGIKDVLNKENNLHNIHQDAEIYQNKEKEQFDDKENNFPADTRVNKEISDSEHGAMVTELLEKDNKKYNEESRTFKKDVFNINDESSICKENQEESVECKKKEAEIPIVFSESIEEDKQDSEAIAQSGLEGKDAAETYSFDKNSIVPKNIEININDIIEDISVHQTKNQEQYDKPETNFTDKIFIDPEPKDMKTNISDNDDKKDNKGSTFVHDVIDKDDKDTIYKVKQEELLKGNKTELDNQVMYHKPMEEEINSVVSDSDNKETKSTKYFSGDVVPLVDEKKNEEDDTVNKVEDTGTHQIKDVELSNKNKLNLNLDTIVTEEHLESVQKSTLAKSNQESNENDKNEYSENFVCKEKLEESMEFNKTESDNQVLSNELISKGQMKPHENVQSDLKNKQEAEVEFYPVDEKAKVEAMKDTDLIEKVIFTEIKEQQDQFNKNKDDNINTIKNKEPALLNAKDMISDLSDEASQTDDQKNINSRQDATIKSSAENNRSDSENKQIEEVVTDDKPVSVNSKEVEKVGFGEKLDKKLLTQLDNCNNNERDNLIDTLVEAKDLKFEKITVVKEIENSTSIPKSPNTQEKNNVEICKLDNKNQDIKEIMERKNKKESENVTSKEDSVSNNGKDSTPTCKQKEFDFENTVVIDQSFNIQEVSKTENNLPIVAPDNTIKEDISKSFEKNNDEDNMAKKSGDVIIKLQEKNKKNGKKKQKPDKKKILEESKQNIREESNIELKSVKEKDLLTKDEDKKIFEKPPKQVVIDDKPGNAIDTGEHTFSAEEYKTKSTEHTKYSTEDVKSEVRDIPCSITTMTKEYFTNTEENLDREYLVIRAFNDNNYEKIDSEREKYRPKDNALFIDHNKTDYTLQFPRPPNYASKSFDNEEVISSELNILNRAPIYKAQTLMHDYQTRSSYSPHIDPIDQRSHSYGERTSARSRSKALSESRSITSEKRTTRDLKRKPVFSTFLTDRTAVESSRVKLTCSILSSSDPTITWYKNGTLLEDKQKFRSKFIDGLITLEVLNAIPNDSGEYSCTVGNEYGSITSSANLKVYPSFEASPIPPTFTRSIRDVYHSLENELVLECRIRGQPLPSITWYKDDKPITLCERYQAHYLADGVCRLTVSSPSKEDSGKYTCHAESSIWSDQIYHNVQFTDKESCVSPNIFTLEKVRLNRQVLESRKPHFTNVISDYKVVSGGTIGLQVEIKGSPTRVEWLREGCSVTDTYRNAQTYFDHGIYTLALTDVTEKESGLYTCRAWSSHGNVDMNASIIVVQPNQIDGKPAVIVSRPTKDILISIGEDINISFRVQGEPKAKVILMKGLRDITHSQRVCKMTSDDYIKFTLKRSVISDAGTYCILARNAYGCDRAFVTVAIRQRASSENLVSDWTYPMDDLAISALDRNYRAVPDRIPSEPSVVDGGKNWISLAWPKPDCQSRAPILAYKVESWLIGKEGGARWAELGITPRNSFDAFNLKQEEEYHFRVTPRNRYGWGESVQTTSPIGIGLTGDRPEFIEILPGQLKVLLGETATLCCTFKGKPTPEILWMKNGHDVEEDTNRVRITLNSYEACLNIENVKVEDEGRYSCEASNIHGRSSTYARMTVITDRTIWEADAKLKRERSSGVEGKYPPQFTMRLRDRRVQATYPVRLTCQVIGSPAPVVTWFKNGEQVTADIRHNMSQDEHFYTLEIAPTTLNDGGVYEAMARNSSGAISCRCSLVVDKGIRAYVAPEFCCGLEPLYQLREGEELRISAIIEAYPSVGVSWYRDGVRLRPSRRAIMTLDRDGQIELALASVTARDAGVYTCTALNEVGRVSTSGKVEILGGESIIENVQAPPIFVSDESSSSLYSNEPRFLRKPRSSEAREGDTVIIECEVIGDPKPEVYWLRDFLKPDYYRDANHFKRVGAGPEYRFEIPHAKFDYTGAYSVIAKNIHGEAKAIISLQILARDPNSSQDAHNIRYGRVEVIPRFDKELTDLLCYDGDAIEFECRVSANPEPDIRWFHYSEVVPECPDFESSYDRGTARLKIKQVTAEDEGTYRCEASNSLGKTTSSACLVVYPPGEPNTLSQRLRRPPALLSGASTPRSTPRTTPRNTPRTTPARSLSATPGPDSRRLCSPCREISPKFYTYPFNRVAEEGDTVIFQCAVKGLPPPWATWDKDGIIITASSRITIKEKDEMFRILEIAEVNVEDVGLYRITLENDYGRAEASARLEVISGKGKFHGTRSYSASPSRRALTYRRRTPSFSRQD